MMPQEKDEFRVAAKAREPASLNSGLFLVCYIMLYNISSFLCTGSSIVTVCVSNFMTSSVSSSFADTNKRLNMGESVCRLQRKRTARPHIHSAS